MPKLALKALKLALHLRAQSCGVIISMTNTIFPRKQKREIRKMSIMQWEIQGRQDHICEIALCLRFPPWWRLRVLFLNKEPSISIYSIHVGSRCLISWLLVHTKSGTSKCIAKSNTNYLASLLLRKILFPISSMFPSWDLDPVIPMQLPSLPVSSTPV